jgi:hypothetical protein
MNKIATVLSIVFCIALLLAPPILFPYFTFKFQAVDFLMPIMLGIILINKWYKNWNLNYVKLLLFIIPVILISIFLNRQYKVINDYFEVYRVITFLLVFIFFKETYKPKWFSVTFDTLFVVLLIFNILHFHNIFHFNQTVMPVYCGEDNHHLTFFGLNSLMQPATKRMLGTLANPNNNAILFILLTIRYLPKIKWNTKEMLFFFAGLLAILATQSKTGFIAFGVVFCVNYWVAKIKWKQIIIQIAGVCLVSYLFLMFNFFSNSTNFIYDEVNNNSDYLLSLTNSNVLASSSLQGRFRIWQELTLQCLQKPIFGHAPQKNYFYANHLYAENGYILWAWRYGIIGVIAFVALFLLPVKKIMQILRSSMEAKYFLLVIITFIITNLTNSPLSSTTLSLLFFIFAGIFYCQYYHSKNEVAFQNNR